LQHVAFEGLGSMEPFLLTKGHQLSASHLYKGDELASVEDMDMLIVMGGPMGIYDEAQYPWLRQEKRFIKTAIEQGKKVLGICLGAQLIADVLGVRVTQNPHREIGWFKIQADAAIHNSILADVFTHELEVFHWHGDTFDIPEGALPIASSEACQHQGFIYADRVVALQFHLETTYDSARLLIKHCRDELDGSRYVQSEAEMLGDPAWFMTLNHSMHDVLEAMGA
jgi:GMP synthase (glutamine-hydrolysing)